MPMKQTCAVHDISIPYAVSIVLLVPKSQAALTRTMPPANAVAISSVLIDIANFPAPVLTRSAQQEYLSKLTSTYKFTYYSTTYGHTVHDAASLRKVLANTMRHHPNPEFGTAGGNAAVDTLFQFGCEMLEPKYVDEVMRAAVEEVVERRDEEEESSDEEEEGGEPLDIGKGGDSERDEDFVPAGRRLRRRETASRRKRKLSKSISERGSISTEEGWREPQRKQTKRKHALRSVAATPPANDANREPSVGTWRRAHVGEYDSISLSQHREECGRDGAGLAVDSHQKYWRSSGLAGHSQPRLPGRSSTHPAKAGPRNLNDVELREAIERLNRRVQIAIVQLWDEIGDMAWVS